MKTNTGVINEEKIDYLNDDFTHTIEELDTLSELDIVKIEINEGLEEALQELDNLNDQFKAEDSARLLDLCKTTVIETITGQFGLAGMFIQTQDGGNVTSKHNFEKGITATESDEQRFNLMEANKRKRWKEVRQTSGYEGGNFVDRKNSVAPGTVMVDEYTGKPLVKGENASLDHIVSASEIEKKSANHLFLSPEERAKMATNDVNLAWTDTNANSSKSNRKMPIWLDQKDETYGTKAEKYNIDREKALAKDDAARRYIKTQVTVATVRKYGTELMTTGGKDAARMAAYSALGVVMRELTQAVFHEIHITFQQRGKETLKNIFIRFKERIGEIIDKLKAKWKDILKGSFEAGITAFLSNIVVFIINLFATTLKKLVAMIRAGFVSLCQAIKMLVNPPAGMDQEEANYQALKIITAGLIGAASLGLSAGIEKLLQSIPGLQPLMMFPIPSIGKEPRTVSDILAVTLSALAGGLLTTIVLYFMDKCREAGKKDKLQIQLVTQSGVVVQYKVAQTWCVMEDGWNYFNSVCLDSVKTMIETKKAIDEGHAGAADAIDDFHRLIEGRRNHQNVEDSDSLAENQNEKE